MTAPDPYDIAYGAIVKLPATTGVPKVKRADMHAHAAVDALRRDGMLSDEGHLRAMTRGHTTIGTDRGTCPACGVYVASGIGLVNVAFTYEPCDCPAAPYVHLVEQLWHREHVGAPLKES